MCQWLSVRNTAAPDYSNSCFAVQVAVRPAGCVFHLHSLGRVNHIWSAAQPFCLLQGPPQHRKPPVCDGAPHLLVSLLPLRVRLLRHLQAGPLQLLLASARVRLCYCYCVLL